MKNKKNYISIDEVQPLIPLSRRVPFYYTEYSKIKRKSNDIRIFKADCFAPMRAVERILADEGSSLSCFAPMRAVERSPIWLTNRA